MTTWWSWLPATKTSRLPWSFSRSSSKNGSASANAPSIRPNWMSKTSPRRTSSSMSSSSGASRSRPNGRARTASEVQAPKCRSEMTRARMPASLPAMAQSLHTCYRIGEIDRSVAFYERLGFEERGRMDIGDEAINVFMGLPGEDPRLELTYNHGVDSYDLGSGYNHIALLVDDLHGTLAGLAEDGIEPEKPPYRPGGRTEGAEIAFVRDPDGYRVELIDGAG